MTDGMGPDPKAMTIGAPPAPPDPASIAHIAQFHTEARAFVDRICDFFAAGADTGDALIVVATAEHRASIERCLIGRGVDVAALRSAGRYTDLDAGETLARVVIGGRPDARLFGLVVGGAIHKLRSESGRVRAFGEMVSLLWSSGQRDEAIRLEDIWNEWIGFHPLSLMCGYEFEGALDARGFSAIASTHADVLPPSRSRAA